MFGNPVLLDEQLNPMMMRPHWQHNAKRDGTRRARLCCNGSKCAASALRALASTHSSCMEHPTQRLFFSIAAGFNKQVCGDDAKDAHAHLSSSKIKTHMTMDDAHAKWHKETFNADVDGRMALPILRALQGGPESGRPWEEHCNQTLMSEPLDFQTTTHDKTVCHTTQW